MALEHVLVGGGVVFGWGVALSYKPYRYRF